jgi:hypothetical protein
MKYFASLFLMAATIMLVATTQIQLAQATGGAGEIKGLIDPMIQRAIQALNNNNTELALEELETIQNELNDTFSVDEDDDDD